MVRAVETFTKLYSMKLSFVHALPVRAKFLASPVLASR